MAISGEPLRFVCAGRYPVGELPDEVLCFINSWTIRANAETSLLRTTSDWSTGVTHRQYGSPGLSSPDFNVPCAPIRYLYSIRIPEYSSLAKKIAEYVPDVSESEDPLSPLIEDEMVESNAGRSVLDENNSSSVYTSSLTATLEEVSDLEDSLMDMIEDPYETYPGDLIGYMRRVTEHAGWTTISVLPYVVIPAGQRPQMRIRVSIEMRFPGVNNDVTDNDNDAQEEVEPFVLEVEQGLLWLDSLQGRRHEAEWVADLTELIRGTSRRALTHRLMLRHMHYDPEIDDPQNDAKERETTADIRRRYRFKARRFPNYASILANRTVTLAQVPIDDRACMFCATDFTPASHIVLLPCNYPRHCVCWQCAIAHCRTAGPDSARCGACNVDFFTTPEESSYLKFGENNGVYVVDARFQHWENVQRSLADLDQQLTTYDTIIQSATLQ
ncbi:hypothetical protein Slin15195_G021280 [Septoria linicola]|uniref:RING-type domain-containing protein n=1 Tax=Septoria linicola TaxID=215465 RepID=A0A9Q9EGD4_9PEZI|nr:hypothetical protein Slin15195_G021280 [Septoria linicola]